MTLAQAKKLKAGDRVVWPEGANGCTRVEGTVCEDGEGFIPTLYVRWDDDAQGDRTYLYDAAAVKFIERLQVATKA